MPQRESVGNTILVALVLCIVCSLGVSSAAVLLRPYQDLNRELDRKKNILDATGLAQSELGVPASELRRGQVNELFKRIEEHVVNLQTGELADEEIDLSTYDARKAAMDPEQSVKVQGTQFNPGIRQREKYARVYYVRGKGGEIKQVVLPVYGKGLWSTLFGYLAIAPARDDEVPGGWIVRGLTFYLHGETPGLGGEVENPMWKAQWEGRWLYGEEGTPLVGVAKAQAPPGDQYLVDGLSGATITSRGVTQLVRYWISDDGFGPFLEKLAAQMQSEESSNG